MYLQVLVPSQRHGLGVLIAQLFSKDGAVVMDDGLDVRLVVHVYDELLTAHGSHHIRLTSYRASHMKKYCIQRHCIHTLFQECAMNVTY
jgi:hypothetical protein